MKSAVFMSLLLMVCAGGVVLAKTVDVAEKAYVQGVSVKSDRDADKVPVKRFKITTRQFNKNQASHLLQVYVEATDAKGEKYFGSADGRQKLVRIDNWSQANWTFFAYIDGLDNAKITAYVVRYSSENQDVLDQKAQDVPSYDDLAERNKYSKELTIKFIDYDMTGH